MKRYDYYIHQSGGKVFDYFGGIGIPIKVGIVKAIIAKWRGIKLTRVVKGASIRRVYIRAELQAGAHRRSYKMKKTLAGEYDSV